MLQRSQTRWVLVAAVVVVFGYLLFCDFTWWDDAGTVHQNVRLNPPVWATLVYYWTHAENAIYIPLTYMVWAGVAMLARVPADANGISLSPAWFHATNLVFHAISTLLVASVLRKLLKNEPAALLGALVFAVHPVQVEAVAWVSGLKDVLAGCLALATIERFVAWRESDHSGHRKGRMGIGVSIGFFFAAMLAKASAMTVPGVILLIDVLILGTPWRKSLRCVVGYVLIAIPLMWIARVNQPAIWVDSPIWARPMIAMDSVGFYFGKILFPHPLSVDYGRSPTTIVQNGQIWLTPMVTLLILGLIGVLLWRRKCLLACGLLIIMVAPAHVLGLVRFDFQRISTVADHYLYLSMLGVAMLVGVGVRQFAWVRWLAIGVIVVFSVISMIQTRVWADHLTLMRHTFSKTPHGLVGANNLAALAIQSGNLPEAVRYAQIALQNHPADPTTLVNAAHVALLQQDDARAVDLLRQMVASVQARSNDDEAYVTEAYLRAADVFIQYRRPDEAQRLLDQARWQDKNGEIVQKMQSRIDRLRPK
jgi:hypothetical protein